MAADRVTDAMVEAACASYWGDDWNDAEMGDSRRIDAREMLSAALRAEAGAVGQDADRYRFLRGDAYEVVVPHGQKVNGSRTGWVTHIHPGADFDSAIDAALAQARRTDRE